MEQFWGVTCCCWQGQFFGNNYDDNSDLDGVDDDEDDCDGVGCSGWQGQFYHFGKNDNDDDDDDDVMIMTMEMMRIMVMVMMLLAIAGRVSLFWQ